MFMFHFQNGFEKFRALRSGLCVFIGLLLASPALQAQMTIENGDTINYVDASNFKQGHWKVSNKIKKLPGYKDDQMVEEGRYVNSKKEGVWKQYYPTSVVKNEIMYKNNVPNGFSRFYYASGKISEEGTWVNNKWEGNYKYYYENGQLNYPLLLYILSNHFLKFLYKRQPHEHLV